MKTPPTTLKQRQERFAHLYAHGLPATEAARRAGYPTSTSETKAYRIAKGKKMQARTAAYRHGARTLCQELAPAAVARLMQIIRTSKNDNLALEASSLLLDIYELCPGAFSHAAAGPGKFGQSPANPPSTIRLSPVNHPSNNRHKTVGPPAQLTD